MERPQEGAQHQDESSVSTMNRQQLISFGSSELESDYDLDRDCDYDYDYDGHNTTGIDESEEGMSRRRQSQSRSGSYAQQHVVTERRRRAKLRRLFITLAALLPPHLPKENKASIIAGAADYIKQLEQQIKSLEQLMATKTTLEMADSEEKPEVLMEGESSSKDGNSSSSMNIPPLEIKARVADNEVLIRVYCKQNDNLTPKLLSEMRKLHLIPLSSGVIPFEDYTDITVSAQREGEIHMTAEDIEKHLRVVLERLYI